MTNAVQGEELQTLRTELKEWEHAFSAANEGRKPGKDDIKKDPTIALKYKTYSRLRLRMQEKTKTRTPEHKPRKLRHQDKVESTQVLDTPSRNKLRDDTSAIGTPSHPGRRYEPVMTPGSKRVEVPRLHPASLDPYESPARLHQFLSPSGHLKHTPHQGTPLPLHDMLGPTPQRDGKALGLFDLLSSSSVTPSKRKRDALAQNQQTPKNKTPSSRSKLSKPQSAQESRPDETSIPRTPTSGRRHSPSPISTSKRYYLANFFATPTTRRLLASMPEDDEPLGDLGMSPLHNRTLPTPSFLRRRSSVILPNTVEADSQSKPPLKKSYSDTSRLQKPNLSPGNVRTPPTRRLVGRGLSRLVRGLKEMQDEKLDDEDELEMLREAEKEADEADAHSEEANDSGEEGEEKPPHRQWKKKGQKRTTRKVNMRPVRNKPKPGPELQAVTYDDSGDDDELAGSGVVIHEDETATEPKVAPGGEEDKDDPAYQDESDAEPEAKQGKAATHNPTQAPATKVAGSRRPRKIKAEAHANYRSLKIHKKPARGRFARRR